MGQQHRTAKLSTDTDGMYSTDTDGTHAAGGTAFAAPSMATGLPALCDEDWQQPPLLAAPEQPSAQANRALRAHPRAHAGEPVNRLREVGLVGIARARAALAEAARRADAARDSQQATKAA
jgi:hypothetical protein